MIATFDARNEITDTSAAAPSRASDWLWRPWYAKLWWATIPVWWLGMAASTRVSVLETFYDSALAGFLNILFFPMTALMVLGVGYVQQLLANFPVRGEDAPLPEEAAILAAQMEAENARSFEAFSARNNIYDPRSGGLYIGNPLSPQNPHHRF